MELELDKQGRRVDWVMMCITILTIQKPWVRECLPRGKTDFLGPRHLGSSVSWDHYDPFVPGDPGRVFHASIRQTRQTGL